MLLGGGAVVEGRQGEGLAIGEGGVGEVSFAVRERREGRLDDDGAGGLGRGDVEASGAVREEGGVVGPVGDEAEEVQRLLAVGEDARGASGVLVAVAVGAVDDGAPSARAEAR